MTMRTSVAPLLLASLLVHGCVADTAAVADLGSDGAQAQDDAAASPVADLRSVGSDAGVSDASVTDASQPRGDMTCYGECVPGTVSTIGCVTRTCAANCRWPMWGLAPGAQCISGATRQCFIGLCGPDGKQTCINCQWGTCGC